jgi:hypothetical protein
VMHQSFFPKTETNCALYFFKSFNIPGYPHAK